MAGGEDVQRKVRVAGIPEQAADRVVIAEKYGVVQRELYQFFRARDATAR